jgi:predicted acyl esterase
MAAKSSRVTIYHADEIRPRLKSDRPFPQAVDPDTKVEGVYFDGYPQIVKHEGSRPVYSVRAEKDIMVPMRDGVHLATDVYRPDVEGEKFPAILSFFFWGKEVQETARWLPEQEYWDGPFWDGSIEAGAIDYFVERGYARVIPDPRNYGKSEGTTMFDHKDTNDMIEWIAKQPWCDGNVGMMGACGYSGMQIDIANHNPPPALKAIIPFENILGTGDHFHGIYECMLMNIFTARHGNDNLPPNRHVIPSPAMFDLPKEELEARINEALNHPDIRYNPRYYSLVSYPLSMPTMFDTLMYSFHPRPLTYFCEFPLPRYSEIKTPTYLSAPWNELLYTWVTFEVWENLGAPSKKLALWPSKAPGRPFVAYSDEALRFSDYFLKGLDTGIMDEPPIKVFVMGVNKWRFEDEWPLKRTKWTKFYLQPGGGLSTARVKPKAAHESFTQPAPYLDPTVRCLTYITERMEQDMEITGPVTLYLEAAIDKAETNWMADLVDVDEKGKKMLVCTGYLAAEFRALDPVKSKPYRPVHPRQDPLPVPPGEVIEYAIEFMPTSNVFRKGHRMQLVIRNQDDLMSRLGLWGVYMLPCMQTIKHDIYFGKSHLLLPVIPLGKK